jgi:DNA-binding GntR family transcriptional regulator
MAKASPKSPSAKQVYQELRQMILEFELYPGSRVTETELAEIFNVSRTPIREAVQRLEAEGYLTVRPKQGCFIRELDLEQLMHFYEVRIALEKLSVDNACIFMKEAQLQHLAEAWDPKIQRGRTDESEAMEALDESFHIRLAEGGGNRALADYLRDVNNHIRVIRRLDFTEGARIDQTYEEHYEICQLLLKRDAAAAKEAMVRHIKRSEEFAKTLTLTQLAQKRIRAAAGSDRDQRRTRTMIAPERTAEGE